VMCSLQVIVLFYVYGRHRVSRWSSGCPLTSVSQDAIALLYNGGISTKVATNIHHASGNWWKGFEGQRSKVKVIRVQCGTAM